MGRWRHRPRHGAALHAGGASLLQFHTARHPMGTRRALWRSQRKAVALKSAKKPPRRATRARYRMGMAPQDQAEPDSTPALLARVAGAGGRRGRAEGWSSSELE